jgi:hypothetical protein
MMRWIIMSCLAAVRMRFWGALQPMWNKNNFADGTAASSTVEEVGDDYQKSSTVELFTMTSQLPK